MAQAKKNEAILQFVRREEYRRRLQDHERWGHVGGRIYTVAKIFYIIGFLFAVMVNLAYIIGRWLNIDAAVQSPDTYNTAHLSDARSALYLVAAMTLVLIAGLVLLLARKALPALICTALPVVLLLVHFLQSLADQISENGPGQYLTRHVLPLSLLLAASIVIFILHVREKRAENGAYEKLTAAIYKKHTGDDQVLSDDEWEALLEQYAASDKAVEEDENGKEG